MVITIGLFLTLGEKPPALTGGPYREGVRCPPLSLLPWLPVRPGRPQLPMFGEPEPLSAVEGMNGERVKAAGGESLPLLASGFP